MDSLRERPGVWYTFSALKANLPAAFAIVLALSSAFAGEEAPRVALVDEEEEPDIAEMPAAPVRAADVLYGTLSRLPVEPVRIAGSLILRKRHGIVEIGTHTRIRIEVTVDHLFGLSHGYFQALG